MAAPALLTWNSRHSRRVLEQTPAPPAGRRSTLPSVFVRVHPWFQILCLIPSVRPAGASGLTSRPGRRKWCLHRGALAVRAEITPVNLLWVMPAKGVVMRIVIIGAGVLGASAGF